MKTLFESSVVLSFLVASALVAPSALAEATPMRATAPPAPSAPAHGAAAAAPAAPAAAMSLGKVLETMNAANYTYARVETPDGEKWLAGPQTTLKVGETAAWSGASEMKNFESKTLNRKFETILFVGRLEAVGAETQGQVAPPHAALSGQAAQAPDVGKVAKAPGGLTVAEVFDQRASLEGKEVVVRGKVVKFNAGVMNRNWVHIRDGSVAKGGDNDLTLTGNDEAAVGDTVTVRGKVVLKKDFGFGYSYEVMLEDASVKVE